ncbi:MAG: RecX family transcriptional regulator [Eubacteriales bacterium]
MMKIERITEGKGYSKRCTISFQHGGRMTVEPSVVAQFCLYPGKELTAEQYEEIRIADGKASAKARAVRMLAYSNLSEQQLRRKLKQKGETEENTEETIEWLDDLKLIDDEQVAKQAVRIALAKGYGKHRIRSILYEKGIVKDLADELLEDLPEPDEAIERFIEKRLKGRVADQKETKRTVDALMRRGHNWSDIKLAMSRYADSLDDYLEEQE